MKFKKINLLLLSFLLVSCGGNEDTNDSTSTFNLILNYTDEISTIKQESYIDVVKETVGECTDSDNIVTHIFESNSTDFKKISDEEKTDISSANSAFSKKDVKNQITTERDFSYSAKIEDYSEAPYSSIGFIEVVYFNVKYSSDPLIYATYKLYGTCFLIDDNVVITNSSYLLANPTERMPKFDFRYNAEIIDKNDCRFADQINVYFQTDGDYDIDNVDKGYAKVLSLSMNKESYLNKENEPYNWATLKLDRDMSEYKSDYEVQKEWYDKKINDDVRLSLCGSNGGKLGLVKNISLLDEVDGNKFTMLRSAQYLGGPVYYVKNKRAYICGIAESLEDGKAVVKQIDDLILNCINDMKN